MDHTVYERKNTDLGSTSMTKSGGFSIKKRHRKLGALIGLAALAVPFAANLGTLGDAIHAVTGPQNVYESELLNVKLKTSQDKTKTTWDLEFDRSETSVSEQTVKFKLDLDKAGLKDAEIKQDDKTLDMREGIVSAVLKSQSTHLILTAISTNEDKHDITLPVTELGLYDDKNGENKLPVDNRSVDLTMAFEKVAEIAKESSSSETVTEEVAKEEKKSVKVAPIVDGDNDGFMTNAQTDPMVQLEQDLAGDEITGEELQAVLIQRGTRTSPKVDSTKTDPNNFQIWSSKDYTAHSNDVTAGYSATGIDITQKLDIQTVAKIDGSYNTNDLNPQWEGQIPAAATKLRGDYHTQFERGTSADNRSSYNITFRDDAALQGANFTVVYDHVGSYVDENGDKHDMGATLSIGNMTSSTTGNQSHTRLGDLRFVEIPNNLYSGILYHGIDHVDITIRFYSLENGAFKQRINVDDSSKAQMTFASLNNFGVGTPAPTTPDGTGFDWTNTVTNIKTSTYAEMVAPINKIGGTGEVVTNPELSDPTNMVKETSVVDSSLGQPRYYSNAHGVYANDDSDTDFNPVSAANWKDQLGSDTFERGGIGFPMTGNSYSYRLYTGTGNTWQTFTCASVKPLQLAAPRKTVTSDSQGDTTNAQYNQAIADLNKAESDPAVQDIIADKRQAFGTYADWKAKNPDGTYNEYIAKRETYVDSYIADTDVAYGDMYGENLGIKKSENIDGTIYFNYDYWVFQPTYQIGTDSIAKPDELIMTDVLEPGVTLRNGAASDIVVFNTNSGVLQGPGTANPDYTVKISGDGTKEKPQTVVVEFTEAGLANLNFNGKDIAWDLNVHVPATDTVLVDHQTETWYNTANVMTGVNKDYDGIDTNKVNVHLVPLNPGNLTINKVDDNYQRITTGAEFKLEQTAGVDGTDGSSTTFEPIVPAKEIEPDSSVNGQWLYSALEPGEYRLTETTPPGGYTIETQTINFTVQNTLDTETEQMVVTMYGNDAASIEALKNLGMTDPTNPKSPWSADIVNTRVPVQFQLNKVEPDMKTPLEGAMFSYALQSEAAIDPEHAWTEMNVTTGKEGKKNVFTLDSNVKLEFNKIYVVREDTPPSGYTKIDNFYFIVVPKNLYDTTYANFHEWEGTTLDTTKDVSFMRVNAAGQYLGWMTPNTIQGILTGDFVVADNAKSIFPRVGGTGIQAYIGAGVIIMLIAGGAAWYIKRRQNQ